MTLAHAGSTGARAAGRAPAWVRPKTVFLAVVLVVLAVYTEMGFGLEWRTTAGRIGPGFFPRIVGGLGILLTLWCLVLAIRSPQAEDEVVPLEDEVGDADLGKHPRLLAVMVIATAAFVFTLVSLGAIISGAVFLFMMLWLLNRGHLALNLAVSLGLPLGLYVLFQSLLNAGLPHGILPRF